jgi:hypothetical protein
MADDNSYIAPSNDFQDEESSNEAISEINQIHEIRNPSVQPPAIQYKPQAKSSWVWNHFIKKSNESGELRAYCQFENENREKCTKNYKYDGSTGNLISHAIKHGLIPPAESIITSIEITKSKSARSTQNKNGQKEKEESMLQWILLTTQPLSTVTHKAFINYICIMDPEFVIPGEKKIRTMIACSYGYNKDKLKQFLKTAQSISLTTDLWSSRSKHGYLGLTATWINQNFEIIDVLLEITYFPAPHTAERIANIIKKVIKKWEIEDRVITITTDNGANMVAAIRELAPIERLSCAAHTLQLAIGKGLKHVENLAARAKQLINFFSTQKQVERLIKIQKDSGYEEQLHLIQDVSTR